MTTNQAAAIRVNWKQHLGQSPCKHQILELARDALGHSTGNYVCILCGAALFQGHLVA